MRLTGTLVLAVVALLAGSKAVRCQETGFLDRSVRVDTTNYLYQVFVPRGYRPTEAWPVILALHGGGEYGRDGISQTRAGLAQAVREHPDRFPAIVVFPQSPPDGTPWFQGRGEKIALAALDRAVSEFHGDPSRVYLTGLSMGGNGAWSLAYRFPERFAALIVVSAFIGERTGGTSGVRYPAIVPQAEPDPYAAIARRVSGVPIRLFHGDADASVPVEVSRRMAMALQAEHADVEYIELAGVGHNAWDAAYAREALFIWLFRQRRR